MVHNGMDGYTSRIVSREPIWDQKQTESSGKECDLIRSSYERVAEELSDMPEPVDL